MVTKFKVTAHEEVPPSYRTGLTEALRALQVNHSLFVPFTEDVGDMRQRSRIGSVTIALARREGLKFSIRKNAKKGGFDIYRTE
jgi:hypothetical protein